jgi:hypothetical protein
LINSLLLRFQIRRMFAHTQFTIIKSHS